MDIADSINLELSKHTNQISTRYLDNQQDTNSVIDLMFLRSISSEHNNHFIHSDWRLTSDHTPLTVNIAILKEYIQTRRHMLVKNSKEEDKFVSELIVVIKRLNTENIPNKEVLEQVIQLFADFTDRI